jgi:hypothetical protein
MARTKQNQRKTAKKNSASLKKEETKSENVSDSASNTNNNELFNTMIDKVNPETFNFNTWKNLSFEEKEFLIEFSQRRGIQ